MKRRTPQQVLDADETTGLTPQQGYDHSQLKQTACGIGAVVHATGPIDLERAVYRRLAHVRLGLSERYHDGFVLGFDGLEREYVGGDLARPEFPEGDADGRAAWDAVAELIESRKGA